MKYIPNSFQVANAVVDDFLCIMSGNAWKCYTVIARKTTGWQKEMDYISVSQFKTLAGIKKDETVTDALKELAELGLIVSVKQHGKVTGYRLNMPQLPPEKEGTTTPEKGVHPKMDTTPEMGGYSPRKRGVLPPPKKGGLQNTLQNTLIQNTVLAHPQQRTRTLLPTIPKTENVPRRRKQNRKHAETVLCCLPPTASRGGWLKTF